MKAPVVLPIVPPMPRSRLASVLVLATVGCGPRSTAPRPRATVASASPATASVP